MKETSYQLQRWTFRSILHTVSLGKYRSKLYHRGLSEHTSLASGLLTIFFIAFLGFFIFSAFYDVLRLSNYSIVQKAHLANNYLTKETRIGEVSEIFDMNFFIDIDTNKTQKWCSNLTLVVYSVQQKKLISEIQFKFGEYYPGTSISCRAQIGKMNYESESFRNLSAFFFTDEHWWWNL